MVLRESLYAHIQLTFCILMDFPIHIKAIKMGLSIIYLKGHRPLFPDYDLFLSLRIVLTLTNSVDPDEIKFYLGLHFLSKYPFRGLQYTNGYARCLGLGLTLRLPPIFILIKIPKILKSKH